MYATFPFMLYSCGIHISCAVYGGDDNVFMRIMAKYGCEKVKNYIGWLFVCARAFCVCVCAS